MITSSILQLQQLTKVPWEPRKEGLSLSKKPWKTFLRKSPIEPRLEGWARADQREGHAIEIVKAVVQRVMAVVVARGTVYTLMPFSWRQKQELKKKHKKQHTSKGFCLKSLSEGNWEVHHQLSGHEFEQTPGDDEGQGSLACGSPCSRRESDTTERLNNNTQKAIGAS